ncbi:hypothetical protein B0H19DRAFT_1375827 [Mycena capillaripes]|nr:hypothetical protein B0H19DRAFT_1375827 [Mycena capillaripes]
MVSVLAADRARVAQISELEHPVDLLRAEKAFAQHRIDSYRYPVLTLPNELVSEIFIHFLPNYPCCPASIGMFSPTYLTQICRKWREIALGTPALWRAISLSGNSSLADRLGHISTILSRSGSCRLSIQMDEYDDQDTSRGLEVLTAALSHRARCEYLQLHLIQSHHIFVEGRMPLLRRVDLEFEGNSTKFAFNESPLLCTAILDSAALCNITLPWSQLTSLTLRFIRFENCLPVLQQTTNLVHCELNLFSGAGSPGQSQGDITIPRLESLTLNSLDEGHFTGYLNTFVVPALRRLQVTEIFLYPNPIQSLTAYLSKSGCTPLEIRIPGERSVKKHAYRGAFPSIADFSFHGQYYEEIYTIDSDFESSADPSDDEDTANSE